MQALRRFDIFPKFDSKFEQDAREKTIFGAALSGASILLIIVLVASEVAFYFSTDYKHDLYVDDHVTGKLKFSINITFPKLPCDLLSLDTMDTFGEEQMSIDQVMKKMRIDASGKHIDEAANLKKSNPKDEEEKRKTQEAIDKQIGGCGSCYGAEEHDKQCCNTCDDVRKAYEKRRWSFDHKDLGIIQCAVERLQHAQSTVDNEGCYISGSMMLNRVQGNAHFAPGRVFSHLGQHVHDLLGHDPNSFDVSHVIHHLSFGETYPGLHNPLDGKEGTVVNGNTGRFQYFIKVVPTRYENIRGTNLETNQYSVTEHFKDTKQGEELPGVFFLYDLSPIKAHIREVRPYPSLAHFVLQLCAISGGVFTVVGLVDAALHQSILRVRRKMQLGKDG